MADEAALHRIAVHVAELFDLLFLTPHIEIVKPPLPELSRKIILAAKTETKLRSASSLTPLAPKLPRYTLLQHLHHRRGRASGWLADQQVDVLRHHHVANQREAVPLANLTEDLHKHVSRAGRAHQR